MDRFPHTYSKGELFVSSPELMLGVSILAKTLKVNTVL